MLLLQRDCGYVKSIILIIFAIYKIAEINTSKIIQSLFIEFIVYLCNNNKNNRWKKKLVKQNFFLFACFCVWLFFWLEWIWYWIYGTIFINTYAHGTWKSTVHSDKQCEGKKHSLGYNKSKVIASARAQFVICIVYIVQVWDNLKL